MLLAAALAGIATVVLHVRRRAQHGKPPRPRLRQGWKADLPALTATVLALRPGKRQRYPAVNVRGAIFYVPPRNDWAVDVGRSAWRTEPKYRDRAPAALFVLNWCSVAPTFVGGGVEREELATPHVALNRELREELGDRAADAVSFGPADYQFSHTRQSGTKPWQVTVDHHFAVVVRDPRVYHALLEEFFDFGRPALVHEVHGAISLPLAIEAPKNLRRVRPGGHNVVGLPSYVARALFLVRTPLLLHLRRLNLVDDALLRHIIALAELVHSDRPFSSEEFWEQPGVSGLLASQAAGAIQELTSEQLAELQR